LVVKLQRLAEYGLLGQVLYMGWAIWLGVKLSRSNAAAPVAARSATA
jgi:hypothetical protein